MPAKMHVIISAWILILILSESFFLLIFLQSLKFSNYIKYIAG